MTAPSVLRSSLGGRTLAARQRDRELANQPVDAVAAIH